MSDSAVSSSTEPAGKSAISRVLSMRDFRLLFSGSTLSLLGDQFALIATPWLVLQLTNDPLILGIVLALEGIPRAVFMLLGGAITDRLSPRLIMLSSNLVRLILTTLMTVVVLTHAVGIWMLYAFGAGFGLVAGFAVPAENSIVPMLVSQRDLQAGNSLMMGAEQLVAFFGPTVAGILIGSYSSTFVGIGLAFGIDAVSFAISVATLWLIRIKRTEAASAAEASSEGVWKSILTGMRYLWNDTALRLMFILLVSVNFLIIGPIMVGIPLLAHRQLSQGSVAFGLLMSGFAGGNLIGYLGAGVLQRPSGAVIRAVLMLLLVAFGLVIAILGFIPSTWVDAGLMALLGLGNGYLAIILITWMQTRTPKAMLGRMMSILMFSNTGLVPVSQAISGAISKWNLTVLFVGAGVLVLLVTAWAAFQPGLKAFSASLSETSRDAIQGR
jgi:MFS family permease